MNEKHARIKVLRVSRRGNFCGAIISLTTRAKCFSHLDFVRPGQVSVCARAFVFILVRFFVSPLLAVTGALRAYALWSSVYIASNLQQKRVILYIFGFRSCVLLPMLVARRPAC